jgi:hypothetical protein
LKLTAFSAQYLRLDDPLPFGVRDANGRLLLAAGQSIPGEQRLSELRSLALYAEESEAADWNRRLAAAVDNALRNGSSLKAVAAARPEPTAASNRETGTAALKWPEQWHELAAQLDGALRDLQREGDWRSRLFGVHLRARQLHLRRPDASLYCLFNESMTFTQRYSCRHALLVMLVCEQAAAALGWPQAWIDSVGRAALTMNVSVMRLQDQLSSSQLAPSAAMMAEIEAHPVASATMLEDGGLGDALCLDVVRMHRDPMIDVKPLSERPPAHQMALVLRRVDVFTAKLSLRASRAPMLPVQAIREACLAIDGRPDEIAGALLKAVGLYPPGSFVELTGGEVAIVLARGRAANQPLVATLVASNGLPLGEPAQRDTSDKRYAVKQAIAAGAVKVRPSHDKLLALR